MATEYAQAGQLLSLPSFDRDVARALLFLSKSTAVTDEIRIQRLSRHSEEKSSMEIACATPAQTQQARFSREADRASSNVAHGNLTPLVHSTLDFIKYAGVMVSQTRSLGTHLVLLRETLRKTN